MQVKEIMTKSPACCTPDTPVQQVAQEMMKHDCGCIPIVESDARPKVVGIITDRDIVCRAVAKGENPQFLTAASCMSTQVVAATPEMDMDTCCQLMEQHQVRRIPVVDALGFCQGIVAQADIAQACEADKTAEVVRDISRHTDTSRLTYA
jgi:CBS domain-containing protein